MTIPNATCYSFPSDDCNGKGTLDSVVYMLFGSIHIIFYICTRPHLGRAEKYDPLVACSRNRWKADQAAPLFDLELIAIRLAVVADIGTGINLWALHDDDVLHRTAQAMPSQCGAAGRA